MLWSFVNKPHSHPNDFWIYGFETWVIDPYIYRKAVLYKPRNAAEVAMEDSYRQQLPNPFERESAFTRRLLVDGSVNGKNRFHCIDVWHALHLGIGKSWAASGVFLLQALIQESNMDKRIGVLASEYRAWCKREKVDPIIRKIDISTFGGGGSNEANGAWHKAAVTSNWLRFLENYCLSEIDLTTASEKLRVFVP